jgi:hypothetical protein
MKHLLSGVALAAVVAVTAPVGAQAPVTQEDFARALRPIPAAPNRTHVDPPATSAAAAQSAAPPASASDQPATARPKRRSIRPATPEASAAPKGPGQPNDRIADQLNRAELGRLPAPDTPAAPGYAPYPPPAYPAPWGYPPAPPPWGYPPPPWGYPRSY